MSLQNVWHHRRVADGSAKACWICFKPSTSVMITPDNKDFFYICIGHLSDRGFCIPDPEEAAAAAARKKKEELDAEIEKVKKDYEEKQRLKREKRKGEKGKDKDKDAKKKEEDQDKEDEKANSDKLKELSKSKDESQIDLGPRIYTLKKNFYQMRLDKIRNAEIAKRNRERLKNPTLFPSVPSGNP
ncbi:DUF1742-domain-containing protein [Melanomma pulvis-pyrius CBS 109.77]|uniref:DUF1742-domain-containing protein n=1 Tax=Melanomma pulvis-pyrius CBS 109.77 TaxID=1314802 RepID=A0A6A6XR53_9PLEO|nr:DUF1742-domain-containing protein [Melanomma pulvis-pyrius CBS 109.77]